MKSANTTEKYLMVASKRIQYCKVSFRMQAIKHCDQKLLDYWRKISNLCASKLPLPSSEELFMTRLLQLFFAMSLLALHALAIGTTGKISGIVRDSKTGEPLPSVNVTIDGTSYGAATNLDGFYVILNVPPGTYTVRASYVGYTAALIRQVRVEIDQTTTLDIHLQEEVIGTEIVEIVAQRPVVQKDVSSSRANISSREVENLPVTQVATVVNLQAGVLGGSIRGGGASENQYMLNGLSLRDERSNQSYSPVSILAIQDIQVQTGGFNAEYGNVRSGIVNVVTREGNKANYSVGALVRYRPPGRKNFGPAVNNPNGYWTRPFLDDDVCWTGTTNGAWDVWTQKQYYKFEGWNSISRKLMTDADPTNDLTPEGAQQVWKWQHRKVMDTGNPDYTMDFSLGGPVPVVSEYLGNLRFFGTYNSSETQYLVPLSVPAMTEQSGNVKLTSDIASGMKLMVEGLYSYNINANASGTGTYDIFTNNDQVASGLSNGPKFIDGRMYSDHVWPPTRVTRFMVGGKFTHVLNPTTFYEVVLQRYYSHYDTSPEHKRDFDTVRVYGTGFVVDESPFGSTSFGPWYSLNGIDGMLMNFTEVWDSTTVTTYSLRSDFVSQLDRYNQLKAGVEFVHTENSTLYGATNDRLPLGNRLYKWTTYPIRFSAYVQDKLEFEGMIANVGLRYELSHAGGEWYRVDNPWTRVFSKSLAPGLDTLLAKEPTEVKASVSPRLGIAFPITENAKLFFNYGHFRSMPTPEDLYLIRQDNFTRQVIYLANPNNELPKTVMYELGYEHNLFDLFLMRLAAYYKDISNERLDVNYISRDASVNYYTSLPNSYRDIRGFEITLTKNRGNWVQGFLNYTYMVSTSGIFGRYVYLENPVEQKRNERENIYQSRPLPRPYARANIDLFTPEDFGPSLIEGLYPIGDIRLNLLASWRTGAYETWVGGGSVPGVSNNLQWKDVYSLDVRASKAFRLFGANIQFFVDIFNVLNLKQMTTYGFVDATDREDYFKSLHLPEADFERFGYGNIPGDDRPGDYRSPGAEFQPMIRVSDITGVSAPDTRAWYYQSLDRSYYRYDEATAQWSRVAQSEIDKVIDSKAYIDMPNLDYFMFLNPRNWFFGVRVSFDLL